MNRIEEKVEKELGNTYMYFTIAENNNSPETIESFTKALKRVGVLFDLTDNQLSLYISPLFYAKTTRRYAGPHQKFFHITDSQGEKKTLRYSDVIPMMQTMLDEDVYTQLGIAPATYYRHKKALKESRYFAALDPSRLDDPKYLESVPGNLYF